MQRHIAIENYNRICGLINIIDEMHSRMLMHSDTELQDRLYTATLGDIAYQLRTLQKRTPWRPVEYKNKDVCI